MKIKLVVFDLDETILSKKCGIYKEYVRLRAEDISRALNISAEQADKEIVKLKRENGTTEGIYDKLGIGREIWFSRIISVEPEKFIKEKDKKMIGFLQSLSQIKVLFSGAPTKQVLKILKLMGIDGFFDSIIGWDEGGVPPKFRMESIFLSIIKRFNISSSEIVVVANEAVADLKVPKAMGMKTVLIEGADRFSSEEEKRSFADIRLKSIFDLKKGIKILERDKE